MKGKGAHMEPSRMNLEDATKARVVILPVGNIDMGKFQKYKVLIEEWAEFEYRNLTLDYSKTKKNLLKKRDIKMDKIKFDFTTLEWVVADDWEDLHFHHKILGVIGILDCQQWSDLYEASSQFQSQIAQEPSLKGVLTRMCLAVEPGEAQKDLDRDEANKNANLIMVPAQDQSRLRFYIKTLMIDFTSTLVTKLEAILAREEPPVLLTGHDTAQEPVDSNKRLRAARFAKQQGDLCLLLGTYSDAQDYYAKSVEQCKSYQDMIWVAAGLEGLAIAKLAELRSKDPSWATIAASPELADIVSRATEAIDQYSKKNSSDLQIELAIKLARLHIDLGDTLVASSLIMKAYADSEVLSIQDKIMLTSTIALLYKDIGMSRKFSFFLRETALHCKKIVLPQRAYHLLKIVAPYYQVHLPFTESEFQNDKESEQPAKQRRREHLLASGVVWKVIHSTLFDDLIGVATEMKDPKIPIRYLVSYLATLGRHLPAEKQIELSKQVNKQTKRFPVLATTGSPGILTIHPVTQISENNFGGEIIEMEPEDVGGPSGPFLYRPKPKRIQSGPEIPIVKASKGIPITIRVPIYNHFHFPLTLLECELQSPEIVCKPIKQLNFDERSLQEVDFSVIAVETGFLKTLNINYRTMNCFHSQPVKMDTRLNILETLSPLKIQFFSQSKDSKFIFLDGQQHIVNVQIENVGQDDCQFINFGIQETFEKKEEDALFIDKVSMFTWNKEDITSQLPLKPNCKITFPVKIVANSRCNSALFTIQYGNAEHVQDHQRSQEIPFNFTIHTGLRLLNFDILECTAECLKNFKEFPPHSNMYEQISAENLDERQSNICLLVFDILNQTSQPFYLEVNKLKDTSDIIKFFSSSSFITIEQNSVRRMVIAIKRLHIPLEEMPVLDNAMKKFLIKERQLTESQFDTFRALRIYRNRLLELIKIHWHSITENVQGYLNINPLYLNESQLQRLRQSPLSVALIPSESKNDDTTTPIEYSTKAHTLIHLIAKVSKGIKGDASDNLYMSLTPSEALKPSTFSWVNKIVKVEMKSDDTKFVVCFHEKGSYQLVAHCVDQSKQREYWSPSLTVNVVE